ncbi:hypothetical protein SAMN04488033_11656 [Salegentibacter agarivorans]|uniref:VCBS repeat-containing protein n=1 Tax=Salegentibacter agarivorans TaxID=345907 RepID=A0A1I2MVJ4_9FLAO|nr:hypothetical protein SAMN04488033_11656 [Salegentibacter agarivorans]
MLIKLNQSKFCIFLILIPLIISAQSFPDSGDDVGSLIPDGYKLKDVVFGDLNANSKDDLVIVIRNNSTRKKSVAIYLHDDSEWKLETESADFFYLEQADIFVPETTKYEDFNDRVRYEEYVNLKIENAVISIYTGDGYGNWIETKFRKNKHVRYTLIGLTVGSYHRNKQTETSINYLTKKAQIKTELIGEGLEGNTDTWYKTEYSDPPYFEEFSIGKILDDWKSYEYEKISF